MKNKIGFALLIFFIFVGSCLISSCKEQISNNSIIIKNMTYVGNNYYVKIEQISDENDCVYIDIDNYIENSEYELLDENKNVVKSTMIKLLPNDNYYYVTNGDEEVKLDFDLTPEYKIIITDGEEILYTKKYLEGTTISREDIINNLPIKNGYAIDLSFLPITIDDNYQSELIYISNTYEVYVNAYQSDDTIFVATDATITLDDPLSPVGYHFIGWYMNDYLIDEDFKYDNNLHGNSVTARYVANTYTINYQYCEQRECVSIEYGANINLKNIDIPGYTFKGWLLDETLFNDETYLFDKDILLTAALEKNEYVIRYQNIDEDVVTTVKYLDPISLFIPSKSSYYFLYYTLNGEKFTEDTYVYTNDITLVAVFVMLDINYETLNGTLVGSASIVDGNLVLPTANLSGYKFAYWSLDKYGLEKVDLSTFDYTKGLTIYANYHLDDDSLISDLHFTLFNKTTSDYDQISIYDKNTKIQASLYWYKIGISLKNDTYVVTGMADSGKSLSSIGDYDYVIMAYVGAGTNYDLLINTNIEIGYQVIFMHDLSGREAQEIISMVSFLPAPATEYDEVKAYLMDTYDSYYLIDEDISLVTTYGDYTITWQSSNEEVVTTLGIVHQTEKNTNVVLTAYIDDVKVYTLNILVKGYSNMRKSLSTGYIYTGYSSITQNAMNNLDIIYCSFLEIDENGNFTNQTSLMKNISNYILPKAKLSGTKVVISVNQSASGAFASVAASETLRNKLASNLLDIIKTYNLHGIDIDWETPTSAQSTTFTLLMQTIYNTLKSYDSSLVVTAAIGGGKWQPPKYDLTNSKNYMDYINLMTYSMATSSGYYQNALYPSTRKATLTSCSIDESITIYNNYGIPNSQILVGIPFYVTLQKDSSGPGSLSGTGSSIWYNTMLNSYPISDTMIEYFDEECGVPYRYDATNHYFLSYDNERSIAVKCAYIHEKGLAGIMFWQYGQDVNDMLINAIADNI